MTVDSTRTRANASASQGDPDDSDDDDDADDEGSRDDARQGGASGGQQQQSTAGTDDDDVDYRARWERERRERRRLEREVRRSRERVGQTDTVEQRATAAERERDEVRAELRRERVFNRVISEATRQNAIDPEAVATMLIAGDEIDVDDDGRPANVADAVKDLLKRKPYLVTRSRATGGTPSGDAGTGRTGGGEQKADFNSAFRRLAQRG